MVWGKMLNKKIALMGAGALVFVSALFLSIYLLLTLHESSVEGSYIFEVSKGAGVISTAQKLDREGVLKNPILFRIYAELSRDTSMKAGFYEITSTDTLPSIYDKIIRGKSVSYNVTIPEGLRSSELLQILINSPYIVNDLAEREVDFSEDVFYLPETYAYSHGENISGILKRMNKFAHSVLDDAWASRDKSSPLNNKKELMTLASIIEKETAEPSERGTISGVFVNRLNKGMRLQTDPTVIYGASNYNGDITRKHLKEKHPYNTYVIKGLPPGPICHPGADAIKAAANPEMHNYYYFVASGDGGHNFSKTHIEHIKNVQNYLKKMKQRK